MKRAIRRHHSARLKQNRAHYWGGHAGTTKHTLGVVVTTPKPCSCWMCGNAREHFGPTLQEHRHQIEY